MVSYQQKITLKGCEASIDYFTDLLKAVKDENGSNTATVLYEAMVHWEVAADSSMESTAGERSGLSRCFQLPLLCCGDRHSKVTLGLEKMKLDPVLKPILVRAKVGRVEYLLEALILVLEKFQAGSRGSPREILVTETGLRCAIDTGGRKSRANEEPAIIRRNSNKEPERKENGTESSVNDWSTRRGQKPLSWRQRLAREQTAPPTSKTGWRARMEERDNGRVEDMKNYGWRSKMLEREHCRAENSINSGWISRNEERENCRMEDSLNSGWRSRMEERENCRMKESQNSGWRSRMEERERDKNEESGRSACGNTVEARGGNRAEDKENRRIEERYNNRKEDKENSRIEERYNKYHWSKHLIPLERDKCKPVMSSNSSEQTFERYKQQMDKDYSYGGKTIERQNSLNDTSPTRIKRKLSTTKEEKKAQENIPKPKKRSTIRKDYELHNMQVPEQSFEERKKMVHKLEDYMWVIPPDTRSVPGFQQSMTKHERHRQGIDCDEVFPGIVLGNGATVKKKDYLKKIGISHVLNAAESRGVNVNKEYFQKDSPAMEYMGLRVEDTPQTQICRYFLEVAEYMDEALLSDGRVFVNCVFGKSRSTTCVAVYLMLKHGWDALKALNHIRQARPVQVNSGFLQQLADLDYKLHWIRKGVAAKNDNENAEENDLVNIKPNISGEEHKPHTSHEEHKLEKVVFEIVDESICAPEKITTKKMISVKGKF